MTATQDDRARLRDRSRGRFDGMRDAVRAVGGVLVAFSGGVDSTLVLAVAREVLGDRAVGLTAHSPSVPSMARRYSMSIGCTRRTVAVPSSLTSQAIRSPGTTCRAARTSCGMVVWPLDVILATASMLVPL